jgi:hypothetical protein
VLVLFDEKRDNRRFPWRFSVGAVLEGDDQERRGLGFEYLTNDIDGV